MTLSNTYPVEGNGLGGLSDAIEATVTHEINGQYEMSMRYPVTGQHYAEIETGRVIMAKSDSVTDAQPFKIYRITKPLNGIVTIYARHLCYEMQGIVVEPFSAGSLTEAFQTIPTVCAPASPITLSTTRAVASGMSIKEPRPLWKLIGGQEGSILDVYGGEWDFDKDEAKLVTQLGADRGISIRYGKNMTQMEQDATIESTYSAVYPFWYDEETNVLVKLTEKFVPVTGSIVTDRVLVMDCTDDFDNQPTEQQLRDRANAYITANSVGAAKTSWKVSFLSVPEADRPSFDRVTLGDTLSVFYERLGVNGTARVVKTEYDVLADRFKALTVGRVKQNLASIIVENEKKTESEFAQVKSALETAVDDATDFIRHGQGYMRFIYNSNNELVEIVSLDDPDITQAQSVWRWNNGGFGFSSAGYNGPYTLAITQNGAIVADFITAGTLNANVIKAGILQDALGKNSWNLDTGAFNITDGSINIQTNSATYDVIELNSGNWHSKYAPLGPVVWNESTQKAFVLQSGGLFGYTNDDGQGNEKQRVVVSQNGIWFQDTSGNVTAKYPATGLLEGGFQGSTSLTTTAPDTFQFTGLYVTIPANSYFSLTAIGYGTSGIAFASISTGTLTSSYCYTAQNGMHVVDDYICQSTYSWYVSTATTVYVWAKTATPRTATVYFDGFSVHQPR